MKPKYYITTPIYYPSGNWHLGHCYTTVVCDALARYKRMRGFDVFYLTGTDEHGQKIEERAKEAGVAPLEFTGDLAASIRELWKALGISFDKFIRTTDAYHEEAVARIFQYLYDKGEIYKSMYEGRYCRPCEAFFTETQLKDGKCPDCGREAALTKEESYFFRLSKYKDRIKKLLLETDYLQPQSRVREMVNNFLTEELSDLSVSRTSFKWGVPVPFDEKHVIYVWIDALANYITALGYVPPIEGNLSDLNSALRTPHSSLMRYWPASLHMVGKEIVRFHAVIWPALLMALGLPLPKKVYGHGWLLFGGDKMSKSKGNAVDPFPMIARYGPDPLRYYLLREVPFGSDGVYTDEGFLTRFNNDLCNDLGNLVSRTGAMTEKYFGGKLPAPCFDEAADNDLTATAAELYKKVDAEIESLSAPRALEEIFKVVRRANKYIDETAPFSLAKDPAKSARLGGVLYNLVETIRICAVLLTPFLPGTGTEILNRTGAGKPQRSYKSAQKFGVLKAGAKVVKGEALFPRLDVKKELEALEK